MTSTLIVPVPKVDHPTELKHLRPTSLCNFSSKVIYKVLSNILSPILQKIISPEQSGFVKGRLIQDNILCAREIFRFLSKKVKGFNLVIKLDTNKAYDTLIWHALIKVLKNFGFSERWIDLIWRILCSNWYSVLVNGQVSGFFPSNKGLRQGDPLSLSYLIYHCNRES